MVQGQQDSLLNAFRPHIVNSLDAVCPGCSFNRYLSHSVKDFI